MFRKVFLIIFLLFIFVGNHALAPSKDFSSQIGGSLLKPFHEMNIAFAAEPGQHSPTAATNDGPFSWSSYIVPGTAVIVLLIGMGSYWLVLRKKQTQKKA